MPEEKQQKISKTKGRPMLHWVGKKPIDVVQSYPAQLVETVGALKDLTLSYNALKDNWHNLLFHGDNKEVLSTLIVSGFRGRVDLVYIDPPFDSGADYVRKVELRGSKEKLEGEQQNILEQTQYTDIWANDNYLQFMYERLILLRELLSDEGSIYLHCDWHKNYQLRILMDEVFGQDNFRNEIIWHYHDKFATGGKALDKNHDTVLHYSKSSTWTGNPIRIDKEKTTKRAIRQKVDGKTINKLDVDGNKIYEEFTDKLLDDVWDIGRSISSKEYVGYPTQKKEELIKQLLEYGSNEGQLILDCFIGSGTTASVSQQLGRKWIGADINKGAIQTTMKRLQKVISHQTKEPKLIEESKSSSTNILHFRVNNYDFQKQHELKSLILEKYDITPVKTDVYFDGIVGERLVKIAELNQPVNKLTIQSVLNEMKNRTDDTRSILIIGSGVELGVDTMVADYNKTHAVNKFEVKDIQSDGIIVNDSAEADVTITKKDGKVKVTVNDYLSPTIVKRLEIDRSIFGEKIGDFRAQIDVVLIDTNYNGKTFNIVHADVPEKKSDFVVGEYELEMPKSSKKVAVKIIDMLGEETLIVE